MNLEQAITTALEFENTVYSVYRQAEREAKDQIGKRIFSVLAKEEQHHVDYLKYCLKVWQDKKIIDTTKLISTVPSNEKIRQGLSQLKKHVTPAPAAYREEIALLQKALAAEQETAAFYKKMVGTLDAEGRELFARFVEIEEGHATIVQAELDAVQGLGYWFDMPEWEFQDG